MKFKSQVFTEASGSVGGLTYSHNRGGLYTRARTVPVNPGSSQQQVIRSAVGQLDNRWIATLTAAQREAWDLYALNTPLLDKLGDPRNVGGVGMYLRGNVPRVQSAVSEGIIDDGPVVNGLPGFTAVTVGISAGTQLMSVGFTVGDPWVDEDGAAMLVYASRPQNVTINYFKGPYRLGGSIEGDNAAPPTSPQTIAVPFVVVAGQRVFVRVTVFRADARLSLEQFLSVDVAA